MQTESLLKLIGRAAPLFVEDIQKHGDSLAEKISQSRFLVVGGAGSIGGAVVRELFAKNPRALHVIDTSENNLAELVRDLRSTIGYTDGDFHAYCFDVLGPEFDAFAHNAIKQSRPYDYVLNFSALKHVRSEKDPFTLMRLIDVNIFLTKKLLEFSRCAGAKKFFCVSTDKAANPVNMMGASKRIMEMFLLGGKSNTAVSTARFANVAFSDGSLPHAWTQRIQKRQPIAAPNDIRRYFVTGQEGAQLCLFSILQGNDREIYFPKLSAKLHLITFSAMAERYLQDIGYEPMLCKSEDEARDRVGELIAKKKWPCFFFKTDTTGEKDFEEFYTDGEQVDWDRYEELGVVQNEAFANQDQLSEFEGRIESMKRSREWTKTDLLTAFSKLLPTFAHKETGKTLDNRM
ncbi:UDP-N-acetylglucosamine 4,6-dehydratase [Aporhodopirellula aestuarii]|uniref:UDP-N-acetylglucosamine 4,6-dehydratase n=1 Tax=Aporhodopirellula aestuarii TaxID=2950107 RepID=A0ABT0UAF5_9BACT|nr:UDP-N-acetylglucosamine 4,6-dehydratase [Aporhodopirellula aestuarii]MCM2373844.1 UDP-N-acetylglucosamine 4,6-dehydratase [Aporhodopirellula aestuarii]